MQVTARVLASRRNGRAIGGITEAVLMIGRRHRNCQCVVFVVRRANDRNGECLGCACRPFARRPVLRRREDEAIVFADREEIGI